MQQESPDNGRLKASEAARVQESVQAAERLSRQMKGIVWAPVVGALLMNCAFSAPAYEAANEQPASAPVAASSAAEALGEAAKGNDAVRALLSGKQLPFDAARSSIEQKIVAVRVAQRQAKLEHAKSQLAAVIAKKAESLSGLKVDGRDISAERMLKLAQMAPNFTDGISYIDQNTILPAGCEIVSLAVALNSMGYDVEPAQIADEYIAYGGDSATRYTGSPYSNGGGLPPCIVDAANAYLDDVSADESDNADSKRETGASADSGSDAKTEASAESKRETGAGADSGSDAKIVRDTSNESASEEKSDTRQDDKSSAAKAAASTTGDMNAKLTPSQDAVALDLTGSSFQSICALAELGYPVLVWTTEAMEEPVVWSSWYQPEHCVVVYGIEGQVASENNQIENERDLQGTSKTEGESVSPGSSESEGESVSPGSSESEGESVSPGSSESGSKSVSPDSSESENALDSQSDRKLENARKSPSASAAKSAGAPAPSSAGEERSGDASAPSKASKSSSRVSSRSAQKASVGLPASPRRFFAKMTNFANSVLRCSPFSFIPGVLSSPSADLDLCENVSAVGVSNTGLSKSSAAPHASAGSSSAAPPASASSSGVVPRTSAGSSSAAPPASASSSGVVPRTSAGSSSAAPAERADSSRSAEKPTASQAPAASSSAKVLVSDSLAGLVKRDYDAFERIYEKTGRRAAFIQPETITTP